MFLKELVTRTILMTAILSMCCCAVSVFAKPGLQETDNLKKGEQHSKETTSNISSSLIVTEDVPQTPDLEKERSLEKELMKTELLEKWGVEIVFIRLTVSNHMLDFRYRVKDPVKAAPLFKRETKPYLVHQATGKVLSVPVPAKTGPLRTSDPPKLDRVYWMFFANAGKLVKKGEEVSVVIGDFKAEKLIVE